MATAIVLGARKGNMGQGIVDHLAENDWGVAWDDCFNAEDNRYEVPDLGGRGVWEEADACIITLGKASVDPFMQVGPTELADIIRANLTLPLLCAQEYMDHRVDAGRLVFIGSYAHDHPITYGTAYCAAKAGLAQAVKTLAWEQPDFQYHIVHPYHCPGTPMWEFVQARVMQTRGWTREKADDYAMQNLRQPEPLTPLEIAQVIQWLLEHESAAWLSGQGLNLYGGTR